MIGLAVLEYVASKIDGLEVEQNCFYEDLPIDYETGQMTNYGVFVTTNPAQMARTSDDQQYLTFYAAIGEGYTTPQGASVEEKYETDRILTAIQNVVRNSLDDYMNLIEIGIDGVDEKYRDVRLELTASRERNITLTNGAIVKNIVVKVIYK